MKKLLSVLAVNIILLLIFYFILNFLVKQIQCGKINFFKSSAEISANNSPYDLKDYTEKYPDDFVRLENNEESFLQFCGEDRTVIGENYTNKPIIVLGCSYAYGHGLKKEQSFSYMLSNLTKRPVYNFAICGGQAVASLDLLVRYINKNPEVGTKISKTDYIIYIYMHNHIARLMNPNEDITFDYDGILEQSSVEKFFNKNRITKHIITRLKQKDILEDYPNTEKSEIFLKGVMKRWTKSISEYAPNAQVIILLYDEKIAEDDEGIIKYDRDLMSYSLWNEIEKQSLGKIKVVHSQDLTGIIFDKNYKLKADIADWHPNAKAWELLTPLFVEKYIN